MDKVYYPEVIPDQPFPNQDGGASLESSGSGSANTPFSPTELANQPFPTKRIAVELLSVALNTRSKKILQEFKFTPSGAIQIGEYTPGVNGDIRISPGGVLGRNSLGDTTFALDGETGDAVFAGTLQTGTLISGSVIVGDNSVIIDGENRRIIVNDGVNDRILIGKQIGGF